MIMASRMLSAPSQKADKVSRLVYELRLAQKNAVPGYSVGHSGIAKLTGVAASVSNFRLITYSIASFMNLVYSR